jgi:glycosyltransferase involved in cell wall biosynthesis
MIHIAYIIDTIATPGAGTEKQLLLLLEKLDRRRFAPQLICLRNSDWLDSHQVPVPVSVMNCGSMKSPGFVGDLRRLVRQLRAGGFQIAQTFFVDGNIYGTVAAHFAGVPSIVSSRRNIGYWHNGLQLMILRFLARWTTHYLANSNAVIDKTIITEKVSRDRLSLIYNGLDLERFTADSSEARRRMRQEWGIADDEVLIGSVANLRPIKNTDSLILAAAELAQANPKLRLVVVGEGDQCDRYQQLIETAGLQDRFHLAGARADIVSCLAAFDIAVLASQSESFSNSLIEYMAAGKPIVASAVGGNIEAIQDGRSGLLFDVTDRGALKQAISRLVNDRSLADRLAAEARREAVAKYAWQSCVAAHEQFYASLAGESK